ncbi:hypothetical protein SBOR_6792 [Sclerotinia borealis F-4128]|uniref:Uncharacterized protein n=1 Tax=Sclerotinia borealis (strain F-4128) TaxID=1432307 RepID=W9CAL4_SCLBF|nr:hypothetical protein SBOR_6792 [Sclerotinia borealis F-4128]
MELIYKVHQTYTLNGQRYTETCYPGALAGTPNLPLSTIITEPRYDAQGKYFVLHKVYRPIIDASSRLQELLYSGYKKAICRQRVPVPEDRDRQEGESGGITEEEFHLMMVQHAIKAIEEQRPAMGLAPLYHDHFARFLHAIGSSKAAMIKTLYFNGIVKMHKCSVSTSCKPPGRDWCEDDLVGKLQWYVPLINKFCIQLQMLVINVREDFETSDTIRPGIPTMFDREKRKCESEAHL